MNVRLWGNGFLNREKEEKISPVKGLEGGMEELYGIRDWRYRQTEEKAPLRKQRMGDSAGRSGLPSKVYGMRPSDHDCTEAGGKKYKGFEKKALKKGFFYATINNRDILNCPVLGRISLFP